MRMTFLSDVGSWKNDVISRLVKSLRKKGHRVAFVHDTKAVRRGDILFILGFFKIVPADVLQRSKTNIVVHESALPKGRGWSPVTWLVIEGSKEIPLTLFEAVEKVDAGQIYLRGKVKLTGHELLPEIQEKVAEGMMRLCESFIHAYPAILKRGQPQKGKPTYYPKRAPIDSRLDPNQSIAKQFDFLRSVDNDDYPAYFIHRGHTYILKIEKKLD